MKNGPYELVIAPEGYPGKRYRDRYCYEHHLVWWQNTGEVPGEAELIHHKNEDKRDNRFENLEKKGWARHTAEHNSERTAWVTVVCGRSACGKEFNVPRREHRERLKRSRSGRLFCTKSCQVIQQQADLRSIPG
jgi:hypothetical protein